MLIKIKKQLLRNRVIGLIGNKDEKTKSNQSATTSVQKATRTVCAGRVAAVHNVRQERVIGLFDDLRKSEQRASAGGYR
jgi:hypothetical protein